MSDGFQRAFVMALGLLSLAGCGECLGPPEVPGWAWRSMQAPYGGLQGPATVTSVDPFTVTLDDGQYWTFLSEPPRAIPGGARLFVEVEENGFGLNGQGGKVVVWALRPDQSVGNLAFAAWYGTRYAALDLGEISYTTEPTGSVCTNECGHRYRSQVYRVRVAEAEARVREETEIGPFTMWAQGYVDEGVTFGACNDHALSQLFGGRLERLDLTF